MDSVAVVHGLSCPQHVDSSQTRDRTCVLCIGRQILNHWTTREVPTFASFGDQMQVYPGATIQVTTYTITEWSTILVNLSKS